MNTKPLDTWIWVLIYGGLILIAVGLSVRGTDDALGGCIAGFGTLFSLVGIVLIWVRSRIKERHGETP